VDASIEERLAEVGYADTAAVPLGATLRPLGVEASIAETLAAPRAATTQRSLPRLSVDLRGSIAARASQPPPVSGADLEVTGVIGEGGMGRVFVARQHSLSREVAVKTAKDDGDAAACAALLVEGATTGMLEHPAIVPVHALGLDAEERPAMVMKRIEGVAWTELAADPEHPGWEGWQGDAGDRLPGHLQIFVQVCNAVHFAHSRGVVHRDIKLENVLIGRYGDVYLADWGVAGRVGDTEARLCGTPGYMAPEMVGGGPIDARTDVYLLGATLHEILTGQMRHAGAHAAAALFAATQSEPASYGSGVPEELGALVNRACHREPAERPRDAEALRDAILRYVAHRESAALARDAAARLSQLERLVIEEDSSDERVRARIDRLIAEASFGFERALADWEGDVAARDAKRRLDAIVTERAERAAALEREAYERDPAVGARSRALGLGVLAMIGMGVSTYALVQGRQPTQLEVVVYPMVLYAGTVIGTIWLRKTALGKSLNRQFTFLLHMLILMLLVERLTGLFVETSVPEHFARDSFAMATGFAVAAIAYVRWVAWVALSFFVTYLLVVFLPEHALVTFGFGTAGACLFAAVFQWLDR